MKQLLIFLLLLPVFAGAQTRAFQCGRYSIIQNQATTNVSPFSITKGDFTMERWDVRSGTTEGQGDFLLSVVNRFVFWFNATPAYPANFTQEGTTGSWGISIPTTPTTTKAFFIPDKGIAITYNGNSYGFDLTLEIFPIQIRTLVNGQPTGTLICAIGSDGNVLWESVSSRTAAAIGTTGLLQYSIN